LSSRLLPLFQRSSLAMAPSIVPELDESTIQRLNARIEDRLKNPQKKFGTKPNIKKSDTTGQRKAKEAPNNPTAFDNSRKRKRDVGKPEQPAGKSYQSQNSINNHGKNDVLLKEILELGGDKEDLDLIADIDSGSEEDVTTDGVSSVEKDPAFKTDLQKLMASLEFPTSLDDASDHSEANDDGELSEQESDEDSLEEVDNKEEANRAQNQGKQPEATVRVEASVIKAPIEILPAQVQPKSFSDSRFSCSPRPDWYNIPLPAIPESRSSVTQALPKPEIVSRLLAYGKTLLAEEGALYSKLHINSSPEHKFMSTVMASGTISDKISALTLIVQESPLHTIKAMDTLLALAKKHNRSVAINCLSALKDLLAQGTLLPADRKLRSFSNQSRLSVALSGLKSSWKEGDALPGSLQKIHLVVWAFEDWLKGYYFDILKIIEFWCKDEIEYTKTRALSFVAELLSEKPEQEANLLRILVNKLGDPEKKVSSKASYLLLQLQIQHPRMKPVVISSVSQELLRFNATSHTHYYALITLNQTILSDKENDVAEQLLKLYFEFFTTLLKLSEAAKPEEDETAKKSLWRGQKLKDDKKKVVPKESGSAAVTEEMRDKLISAVLTGINRAFPFSKMDDATFETHIDSLFKIAHAANVNTRIQALMLIYQVYTSKGFVPDRFYRTLYESLLDQRLTTSSKQTMFLNLLYKALHNDVNRNRVAGFVKRLMQILNLHQPSFACGILYLVKELTVSLPSLRSLLLEPEDKDGMDSEPTTTGDNKSDTNNPPRSNKYDGTKRDPEYSRAEKSCLWEIVRLLFIFYFEETNY
jgi:ribosome biogenesis protein MAK21